ncbi:MAG: YaeQ family protein, partial [Deltaproteobacteria bacterium]|nr:YaeQ family protein [Deltaproteobacteria bacterium]
MALPPTLHDFEVALSHVDRGFDAALSVRTARHPSETQERLWLRLLAFCLFHEERLAFGPGLGEPEAPDLEARDLTGQLTRWIRVGKADPAKVQRAADQNGDARVSVLFESPAKMEAFVAEARAASLSRLQEVELVAADPKLLAELAHA